MKIVLAGGTGFIGKHLREFLIKEGHEIVILTRKSSQASKNIQYVQWVHHDTLPEQEIKSADVFVNLAGTSLNEGRWNERQKKQIYESRINATRALRRIIEQLPKKPAVLINASAIGIYPTSIDAIYTENSSEIAPDFLGKTVKDWEDEAKTVEQLGIRTVFMRFGVVLGKNAGALPLMVLPYQMFVGGRISHGKQWVSWIHIEDVVRAIHFAIMNSDIQGPVNVTAPHPVQMETFGKTIAAVIRRPHWFPVPSLLLQLLLGDKSKLILEGQHVQPKVLIENGFTFKFPTLTSILKDLLKSR